MKLLWIPLYFQILSCFFQVPIHWLLSVLSVLYTLAGKGYSLLSRFYKLALPLLWGLCLHTAIFKKCVCLYAAFLKKMAAKLNHYQRVKLPLMWHLSWSILKIIVLWFCRAIDFHYLKSVYICFNKSWLCFLTLLDSNFPSLRVDFKLHLFLQDCICLHTENPTWHKLKWIDGFLQVQQDLFSSENKEHFQLIQSPNIPMKEMAVDCMWQMKVPGHWKGVAGFFLKIAPEVQRQAEMPSLAQAY